MHPVSFVHAVDDGTRRVLFDLESEYLLWVRTQLQVCLPSPFQSSDAALLTRDLGPGDTRCQEQQTSTSFHLLELEGQAAGLFGTRMLNGSVAEIKRLYVRARFRGMGLGLLTMKRVLADANSAGCTRVVLDSAPFMAPAHRLYAAQGFSDCPAYEGTEVPVELRGQWRFMQKDLRGSRT